MSNANIDPALEAAMAGLRADDLKPAGEQNATRSFVKPTIHDPNAAAVADKLHPEDLMRLTKMIEEQTRKQVAAATFDPSMPAQVMLKSRAPITDFSKMTLDDVYDLSVPIEAKPFMNADVLSIKLLDTNYEARWVNKNPQRLGDMIGKGFSYVVPEDIFVDSEGNKGIETGTDSEGHFCFNDVVAMKIDKATYYRALRAAHERAVSTTNETVSRKRAAASANAYMQNSEVAGDFNAANTAGKMKFYDPGIEA